MDGEILIVLRLLFFIFFFVLVEKWGRKDREWEDRGKSYGCVEMRGYREDKDEEEVICSLLIFRISFECILFEV